MESDMERTGTGIHLHKRYDGREVPIASIEVIYRQLIQAEVCLNHEAVVRGDANPVRVRRFLAFLVRALTAMLHKTGHYAQTAVVVDRERRYASAIVIRD